MLRLRSQGRLTGRLISQGRLTGHLKSPVIDLGLLAGRLVSLQDDCHLTHPVRLLGDRLGGLPEGHLTDHLVALLTSQPRGLLMARLAILHVARLLTRIIDRLLTHIDKRRHP